ncbi:chromosome segregation atpase [Stagonosporopsis vannaccii]|nr:chromosome segregation atpase [Stagonosporopsis vannaccii]
MSSMEREHSQDRELVRHHGSSFSSMDRAIPMWDSADPDRAPPPLPMNPGSPTLTTRPNTSAAIMRAAKALEEKARESLPTSSYTTNPMPGRSPERSLIKGNQHKRMQSLQPSSVRDLRSYLDSHKSPERSPERPRTRDGSHSRDGERDYFGKELDPKFGQFGTPSPSSTYDLTHTPTTRPSHRAILGENTPPSATMKALQTMTIPPHILDPPLQNITNASTPTPAPAQPLDSISTQLLSITNIVSSLQKDMSQLSRRSKDNATDLISLKEATNSRDEDIRKSLKDLLSTMSEKQRAAAAAAAAVDEARSAPLNLHDPHMTPTKQFTFPRMSSPSGWTDERMGSPNPYSVEGAASVAMLEKIIREMVTKDGQERLIASLQVIVDKANGDTAKKVSELVEFVKSGSASHNLAPPGSASFQPSPGSGALTRTFSEGYSQDHHSPKAADFVSDEMLKYLRKIKDSAAENGCVTMATKTLVQELRGEVLGMGRELARKIEEAEQAKADQPHADPEHTTQEISAIIQEGLDDLKEYMDKVMRERRRQSMSSVVTRGTVDNNEVYDVVKHALAERGLDQYSAQGAPLDKEAIVAAIREAYDSVEMKPNVEIQQFGLERDEILQCLREGLQDYNGSGAVSREEIGDIVQESLQQLRLPPPVNEANEMREEILMAVRDSLEELKPSLVAQQQPHAEGVSREVILDAIKEALSTHEFGPQEVEIPQEALFDAVKAGLEASQPDVDANNEVVVQRIQALVDSMHSEFKAYSAANGRDTEQVLDAMRDGLDRLTADLQGHFDKASDATQQDAIIDSFRVELDKLREDVQGYVAEGPRGDQEWSRGDMVTFIKTELENLHEGLIGKLTGASGDKEELLAALKAGFDEMNSQVALRNEDADSNEDINEALKHEFDQLKEVILGDTAGHKNDILEKLEAGFDGLQVGLREATSSPNDDLLAAMKGEFEHLRETIGGALVKSGGADKDDIIDAVRELMDGLRAANDTTSKESVTVLQADLGALKESLGGALVPAGDKDKEEILDAIKASLEQLKTSSASTGVNEELLEAFRGELEQIRQSDGLTRQHGRADTEEVLEAVRLGLDDLRSHLEKKLDGPRDGSSSSEIIDALHDGLEGLRTDVTKLTSKPVDMTVSYEILDTLKEGIATLREDVALLKGKTLGPAATREVEVEVEVDAVPTGNEMVLAEVPSDGPVGDRGMADEPAPAKTTETVEENTSRNGVPDSTQRNNVDKMEFILSQIHAKVEAMDATRQTPAPATAADPAPNTVMKDDLVSIEGMLKEVQAAVLLLQEREASPVLEGFAKKEDTDAIETLVANTKAKIEELVFPDPATAVTKENLEDVELVVRTTSEALDALAKKFEEEGATKTDVTVVQVIADDIKTALDEMKAAKPDDEANPKATKADVDAVSLLVDDLKAKLDDMKIPDPEEIPSKADMEQLTGLIHEFRDSHEKMKDTYEEDILKTANNFDDRRKEAETLVENITEVKTALDTMKEEVLTNFKEGGSIEDLKTSLTTLQETIGANNVTSDVKELMETLTREFERAHGSIEGLQNDHAEKSALHLEKHDEIKGAIVADFTEKLEDKFNTLMAKYDDAQLLADEQARVMKEKAEEQEKILETTKTMADELRLTIDTLGATIAGMNERFEEHQTKQGADSATAFEKLDGSLEKIDGAVAKFEEQKLEDKSEHTHTRDEVKNIEKIFLGLQDEITEHNPKFMMALREIEALVKAHYDHAQKSKEEAEEHTRAINEEAKARSEEIQNHFANLPKLLPAPPPEPEKYNDAPVQEKLDKLLAIEPSATYDDAVVQEKLDKLLGHADDATKASGQLERLDEIHVQVKATAVEISDFVAKQTQLTLEGNESKEREAEELALLVERRSAQKEQLEADLDNLKLEKATYKEQLHAELDDLKAEKDHVLQEMKEEKARVMAELKEEKDRAMQELKEEKDSLLAIVASLQAERENLANQKVRLTGEVSSLRTALEIRREELHLMDAKADALERRILNGIMDHSRALMIAKGSKSPSKLKKRMSVDGGAERSLPPNATANAVNMALKPRPAIRRSAPNSSADRRIFSLSQISGNAPPAAKAQLAPPAAMSSGGLKRAQSTRTSTRKSSWNGRPSVGVANKENAPLIEEAEPDAENHAPASVAPSTIAEDEQSETGTERRYSVASESNYTESHADGETVGDDGRSNYGSEYTYGSGSYMTGSDIDRRTSYGSTIARSAVPTESAVEGASESESEDEEHDDQTTKLDASVISGVTASDVTASDVTTSELSELPMPTESAIDRAVAAVAAEMKENPKNFTPTDSGLGTEPPTAALDNGTLVDADYFRRAAEEESVLGSTVG